MSRLLSREEELAIPITSLDSEPSVAGWYCYRMLGNTMTLCHTSNGRFFELCRRCRKARSRRAYAYDMNTYSIGVFTSTNHVRIWPRGTYAHWL
ncbi:hypothetical protein HJFPF1_11549 [Paramyrothecium foliicola]|nr:hypothetical protein HJFPF1_11549 [Paramyrothecium foliicola]